MEYTKSDGTFLWENGKERGELLKNVDVETNFKILDKANIRYVLVDVKSGYYNGQKGYFPLKLIGKK
jgi:hypothetical protein